MAIIDCIRQSKPRIIMIQECTAYTQVTNTQVLPISIQKLFEQFLSAPYAILEPSVRSNWKPFSEINDRTSRDMKNPYYCLLMVSKFHYTIQEPPVAVQPGVYNSTPTKEALTYYFPNTVMGRHLLSVTLKSVDSPDTHIYLATTHLESTVEYIPQKLQQFELCLNWMATKDIK